MLSNTLFSLIFLLCFVSTSWSQITFQHSYLSNNAYGKTCNNLLITPEGDYLFSGRLYGNNENYLYLTKVNAAGDVFWSYKYELTSINASDNFEKLIQTNDGGYLITTVRYNPATISQETILLKLTANGSISWSRSIANNLGDLGLISVLQADDGNFVLTGSHEIGIGAAENFYVLKISSSGSIIWDFRAGFGGGDRIVGRNIKKTSDNGYIIVGHISGGNLTDQKGIVIKLNTNGMLDWHHMYDINDIDFFNSVDTTSDGGYIIQGAVRNSTINTVNSDDIAVLKINPIGTIEWAKAFYVPNYQFNRGHFIKTTVDNGYIISGTRTLGRTLIKLDNLGNYSWSRSFSISGNIGSVAIALTNTIQENDGGYTLANLSPTLPSEIHLIRTNTIGQSQCNEVGLNFSSTNINYAVSTPQYTQFAGDIVVNSISFTATPFPLIKQTLCESICIEPELDSNLSYLFCDEGCIDFPNPISIQTEGTTIDWNFSNGIYSNLETPSICFDNANGSLLNSIDLNIKVTSRTGCESTVQYNNLITISTTPKAFCTYLPDSVRIDDPIVQFYNESENAIAYEWSFGDGSYSSETDPLHTYPSVANAYQVKLLAKDHSGNCSDTYELTIPISDEIIFYIPNAFTPDDGSQNTIFKPIMTSGVEPYQYRMVIYNRWGEIIFISYDYEKGWDGLYNQILVERGVYIWRIDFKETMTDKKHAHTGHVTVLR